MKIERFRKSHKKEIILRVLAICVLVGAHTFATSKAKYKLTQDIPLVRGTVNYKVPDMRTVALYTENDSGDYIETNNVPTSGYTLNSEKSMCKVYDGTTSIENAPKDNNVTIEYKDGSVTFVNITKKNTRCYLYLDKKDTSKPIISNVATSVTKTEITITVTASDVDASGATVAPTEYWYQIDSNTAVQGTGNTYKFTGLTAGTTHTIKVYVKDGARNTSDTTTKSVTTASPTASETILANVTAKTTTPDFSQTATTNEGVFKVSDGMYGGTSYYWRGAVTNNYVKFANKCWRIIRINGDGTLRLIYDGTTCHDNGESTTNSIVSKAAYNPTFNASYYVGWTYTAAQRPSTANPQTSGESINAKTQLESWYNSNLKKYESNIADSKFCNDRNVGKNPYGTQGTYSTNGTRFYYSGYYRLSREYQPTLSCSNGDVYSLKVGLITADEAELAGGKDANNITYYLNNGQNYWTMTPYDWYTCADIFCVGSNGYLGAANANDSTLGVRPVISLNADTTFKSGSDGTLNSPYEVE